MNGASTDSRELWMTPPTERLLTLGPSRGAGDGGHPHLLGEQIVHVMCAHSAVEGVREHW